MPTREPGKEVPSTQTLAYWMGRVDTNIVDLKNAMAESAQRSAKNWEDFAIWRRGVDERLHDETTKSVGFQKQVDALEKARCPLGEQCPALKREFKEGGEEDKDKEEEKKRFGTWPWFRDKYLEQLVLITLTILLYKIVEIVISHWNVPVP